MGRFSLLFPHSHFILLFIATLVVSGCTGHGIRFPEKPHWQDDKVIFHHDPSYDRRPVSSHLFKETIPAGKISYDDYVELAPFLEGMASWYGPDFHGKHTANGEIYNQWGMTAAHPILPMGTRILVENMSNGHKIRLRINDRGPYKKGRVLDLSKLAAKKLKVLGTGTAPVRIQVIRWPKNMAHNLGIKAYRQYVVQLAAYQDSGKAKAFRDRIEDRFDWMKLKLDRPTGKYFTVVAGPYDQRTTAVKVARTLSGKGIASLVRSYRK